MTFKQRKRYLVDKPLQDGLSRRLLAYFCAMWLIVFAWPICIQFFYTSIPFDRLASILIADFWFPMMMSVLLLPIVIWDSVRFSNRVAGPIYRISQTMRRMAGSPQEIKPIQLRKNDFCQELANDVNWFLESYAAHIQTEDNSEVEELAPMAETTQ